MGYFLLGWRLRRVDIAAMVMLAGGLTLLVAAAEPSVSRDPGSAVAVGLALTLALTVIATVGLHRLPAQHGASAAGALSGLAFAVLAIAARPLAGGPWDDLLTGPWLWLTLISAVVGQALLAAGFKRGSPISVVIPMDATTVVGGALAGVLFLGDSFVAGRVGWVAIGLTLVIGTIWVLGSISEQPKSVTPLPASQHVSPNLTSP